MTEHDLDTLLDWRGRTVRDRKGETIGKIGDLYLDEATDRPAYAGVRTGLLGRRESVVPLAEMVEREGDLVVPYDVELVRDAPAVDPDDELALDDAEGERLARHYGTGTAGGEQSREAEAQPAGDDASAERNAPPGEMIRSEEELVTGTTPMRPAERVRLRKVLVTEQVQRTVPVRREEIRLETDPPPEGRVESVADVGDDDVRADDER